MRKRLIFTGLLLAASICTIAQSKTDKQFLRPVGSIEYRLIRDSMLRRIDHVTTIQGTTYTYPYNAQFMAEAATHYFLFTGNNDPVYKQFEQLLNDLASDGWEVAFEPELSYTPLQEAVNFTVRRTYYEELHFNLLLSRRQKAQQSDCPGLVPADNVCAIEPTDGFVHCKGTVLLQPATAARVRSGGFKIPLYPQIKELDMQLCNTTNSKNIFVVYSTKFGNTATETTIAVNAMNISGQAVATDAIMCTYDVTVSDIAGKPTDPKKS